jgi:hypothetical protein
MTCQIRALRWSVEEEKLRMESETALTTATLEVQERAHYERINGKVSTVLSE